MTYKQLRDLINELSDEQLAMDVSVYMREAGEYFPLAPEPFAITDEEDEDVLDPDHPYLII